MTLTLDDFRISPRVVQVQSFGKMVILSPALRKKLRRSGGDDLLIVNDTYFSEERIHRDEFMTWVHVTLCLKFHFQLPGWQKPWCSGAVSKIGHLLFDPLTLQGYWWLLTLRSLSGKLQQLHINSLQATMNLMWTSLRNQECPCHAGVVPPEWLPRMLLQHVELGSLWGSG